MKEEVKLWWDQATADMENVEILFEAGKYSAALFFCQQAVEKALKAFWIRKTKTVAPKYHNLLFFFKELRLPKKFKSACEDLTGGYITTRYPTDIKVEFSSSDAEHLLNKSREILQWVLKKIS